MKKRRITPEETKERLVDAGLHLFGLKGFESTRTREIAKLAEVNQAAIPYHFGGKEGLYKAVAHEVVTRAVKDMSDQVAQVSVAVESPAMSPEMAGQLLVKMLEAFLDRVVMAEDISDRSRFVMREYSSPGAGFDIIYNGFLGKTHALLCTLVGRVIGENPESEAIIIRTHALFGSAVGMVLAKTLLLRRLGWDDYTQDSMVEIKKIVSEVVTNALQLNHIEKGVEKP